MAGTKTTVTRTSSGAEKHGVISYDNPVDGLTSVNTMKDITPIQFVKIIEADNTVSRDYPYDGDGLLDGGTASTVTFDAASGAPVPTWFDARGLLVLMTSGTQINEIRKITAYNTSTRVATLDRVYSGTAPSPGDSYLILVDCMMYDTLYIKPEFSNSGAGVNAKVIVALYDTNKTPGSSPTARKPIRFHDVERTLNTLNFSVDPAQASYYHGVVAAIGVRGCVGAKVRLTSISGGTLSLWASGI